MKVIINNRIPEEIIVPDDNNSLEDVKKELINKTKLTVTL